MEEAYKAVANEKQYEQKHNLQMSKANKLIADANNLESLMDNLINNLQQAYAQIDLQYVII